MREVAHFLKRLGGDSREANGRTILENALFTLSTESDDGRHNDVKRELSGIFHAVTLLEAHGTPRRLDPAEREFRRLDGIRA